jgi:cytochrome c oxidase assembly protein subunit 15
MGHFLLSQLILVSAVALYWRARTEPNPLPTHDRRTVLLTRALLVWGAVVLFAGTLATAAGPHPGHNEEGEPVARLTSLGPLDDLIHWHGRTGTVLGLLAVGTWLHARRQGWTTELRTALTTVCLLIAAQGVIGFVQYELELPAALVWLHVAVASAAWTSLLFANAAAGRLSPTTSVEEPPQIWGADRRTSVEHVS